KAIADSLGKQDVDGPTDGRDPGERYAGEVDIATPGFGEQHDAQQRQSGKRERSRAMAAHRCDRQRADELDRDGGAKRDATNRGEERDGFQSDRDAQTEQRRNIMTAYRA